MDIEELKEPLGDEMFTSLKTYVDALVGQRDAARNESINQRKTLKKEVADLTALRDKTFEKLGIASTDELEELTLPDAGKQAELVKQLESKIKRLTGDLDTSNTKAGELESKWKNSVMDSEVRKAISSHEFIDADVAALLLRNSAQFDGDEILFSNDGKLIPLSEGAAFIAKSKPHLVKAKGNGGGSGYHGDGDGKGGAVTNPWKKETWNLTEQGKILTSDREKASQLAAAAGAKI